jgi:glycosyltransferase involved in cell wall biosynthesis
VAPVFSKSGNDSHAWTLSVLILQGAYLARLDISTPHHSGVAKKMKAQVAVLQAALGPVDYFGIEGLALTRNGEALWRQPPGRFARKRLHAFGFYPRVIPYISDSDYIYIRYQRSTPVFLRLLRHLKAQSPWRPILVELPTYPYRAEQVSPRDRLLGLVDRACRGRMAGLVDRIVTFSDRERIFGIPTIRTQNGVDLTGIPLASPPANKGPMRLVAVANLGVRHAYDRVIAGLGAYSGARPIHFDIIGSGSAENELRAQVSALGLEDRVTFAGPLSGAALDARIGLAHVGVAALGMHRIATKTTDLKSREYCARGLPFVTSNPDTDFSPAFPFALKAPADDSPLDIMALTNFYAQLRKEYPGFHSEMRGYANARLGWDSKMRPVITEIRALLGQEHIDGP